MSEPFSLVLACQITPDALRGYLAGPVQPPDRFQDWDSLGYTFQPGDFGPAEIIAERNPYHYLRTMRMFAADTYGWRFHHDTRSNQLNLVSLAWTENWPEMLAGANVLRQLASHAPDGGYVLAHGFAFRQGKTAFAINFAQGKSRFIAPTEAAPLIAHATPIAEHVLARSAAAFRTDPRPAASEVCRDQLSEFKAA